VTPLTVGVIGGMGPAATVHFMARVLALTPAKREQDHLRLLVDCNPRVPDRNDALRDGGPSPESVLAAMARGLECAGAELLVMPCNTAHAFAGAITAATSLPFINLIEAASDAAVAARPGAVGVLAADGCLEAGLYQEAFARRGAPLIACEPDAQRRFMELLYQIKSGDTGDGVRAAMRALAEGLIARGAEVVVAGCTEVPLALGYGDIAVPLIDSIDVLALRTIAQALRPRAEAG